MSAAGAVSARLGGFFQFQNLGVLRGFDPADAGLNRGNPGIPVGGGRGVGGGELGGQQRGAFGAEDAGSEEGSDDQA
jgi:hypothetical protein